MNNIIGDDEYPLVTVITPTYNSNPQYLFEAIESVLIQTYPKIEYIISDDGSNDFREDNIRKYLESNCSGNIDWKIIRNKVNVGTVKNMNRAIHISQGKYIFGLAQDDEYYDENVIYEWVKEFQRTGAMAITSRVIPYENSDNIVYKLKVYYDNLLKKIQLSSPKMLNSILCAGDTISAPATAQSKDCFQKYGLYDERYKLMEDYPRWLKLSENDVNIKYWDRIVVKYRTDGMSNNSSINICFKKEEIFAYQDLLKNHFGFIRCIIFINLTLMRKIVKHLLMKSDDGLHAKKDITIIFLEISQLTHKLLSNLIIIYYINTIQMFK